MNRQEPLSNSFTIEPDRSVSLEDVGGDYHLGVALSSDGVVTFVLFDPYEGSTWESIPPPHEMGGPLPLRHWRRCNSVLLGGQHHRCGRLTRRGDTCMSRVTSAGLACRWHQDDAATPESPITTHEENHP